MKYPARLWLTAAASVMLAAGLARAEPLSDWNVKPLKLDLGDGWSARLGGSANLTAYDAGQSALSNRAGVTASAFVFPRIEKLFDNGWRVGLRSSLNLYHDNLSGDQYGNDVFQKVYLFVHAPWGRVELGQQDGAAYKMAITGPVVANDVAIDDAKVVFFRDPLTGRAFNNAFRVRSGVFATSNAAKISYYSPRLFGVQIGASYTPRLVKDVLPFAGSPPHLPDRQDNLIEGAINYTGYFGQTALGAYAGIAAGHNAQRTPGHEDLLDWGLGAELDYNFGDTVLAVGGAFRQSNGYAFAPGNALHSGTTHAVHASTKFTHGPWQVGFEYSNGVADALASLPKLDLTGYQIDAGYDINANLQLVAGWQHQRYTRSSGAFYTGGRALNLNAGFLYLRVHV